MVPVGRFLRSASQLGSSTASKTRLIQTLSQTKDPLPYPEEQLPFEVMAKEKCVRIQTCGDLFAKWRKERRYWTVPKSHLEFDVKYLDTNFGGKVRNKSSPPRPLVLALHGSPGSFVDFHSISSHLYQQGARIIAPNFPGCEGMNTKEFRHTPEEKSQYVQDFLRQLNVKSIDMLICHSSALFAALPLCLNNKDIAVNSLAMINPTGLEMPKAMQPFRLVRFLVRCCETDLGLRVAHAIGRRIANKPELKGGKFEEHYLSAVVLTHSAIHEQSKPFEALVKRDFPMLLAFSENDKLISKRTSYKMASMMVDEGSIEKFDENARLQKQAGETNPFRKVLVFKKGSHFLMKTYPQQVSEALSTFLFKHLENRAAKR